jgi:hypothetical protein
VQYMSFESQTEYLNYICSHVQQLRGYSDHAWHLYGPVGGVLDAEAATRLDERLGWDSPTLSIAGQRKLGICMSAVVGR